MLLPALSRSKARANAISCMNNSKHLTMAWFMYSSDNNDFLVYNLGGSWEGRGFASGTQPNWVTNVMDWNVSGGDTNTAFVGNSLLGPYAGYAASIYHCPEDRVLSDAQKAAGWTSRVRSTSMNAMVGNPGDLLSGGTNSNNPNFQQFLKESQIRDPERIFVFLDEHPDSINDGYFLILPNNPANAWEDPSQQTQYEWQDLPASYHNGGGSFSFADGHTEIHHWLFKSTCQPNIAEAAQIPLPVPAGQEADYRWLLSKTSDYNQ
jgi:prepilin-type processing-associated H-X9-DG protein